MRWLRKKQPRGEFDPIPPSKGFLFAFWANLALVAFNLGIAIWLHTWFSLANVAVALAILWWSIFRTLPTYREHKRVSAKHAEHMREMRIEHEHFMARRNWREN